MRTLRTAKTLSVLGGLAAALSLSACGMTVSFDEPAPEETAAEEAPEETAAPSEDGAADGTTDRSAPAADQPTTESEAGDGSGTGAGTEDAGGSGGAGFSLDEDGTGVIPADILEEDIREAYANQGTTIEAVECSNDMHVWNETGSSSCTVTAGGEEHYGVAKVVSVSGQQVEYELEFAGVDF